MRPTSKRLFAVLILGVATSGTASSQAVAVVDSNDLNAHVYADSTWLGLAGLGVFKLPVGTREVRVVPRDVGVWGLATITTPTSPRIDTVRVSAQFPYAYKLEATPVGADVYRVEEGQRTYLGATPQVSMFDEPMAGTLLFEKPGFATVEVAPGSGFWNRHLVVMRPLTGSGRAAADLQIQMPGRSRRWIEYAAVSAAVVGGVLAVHYKTKADNRFDAYQETGNPDLRPSIEQFDTRSAWALGAMQAGVGVFAIRLAFR
jgi:hypothetical protein